LLTDELCLSLKSVIGLSYLSIMTLDCPASNGERAIAKAGDQYTLPETAGLTLQLARVLWRASAKSHASTSNISTKSWKSSLQLKCNAKCVQCTLYTYLTT